MTAAESPVTTQTLNRRYQLRRKLGEGGMGAVFVAYDRLMKQEVALKRVGALGAQQAFDAPTNADDFALALAREFRVLAGLRHPHIISVLDYGFAEEAAGGEPYFTMELLHDARGFHEALTRLEEFDAQVGLFIQLLQALAYLHRCGILHRDLKPANVLVMPGGSVKVLDFGLAGQVEAADDEPAGTLLYLSPELLTGGRAGQSSDLYAVGVMLYEWLSGRHPFYDEADPGAFINALLMTPPDLSRLPETPDHRAAADRVPGHDTPTLDRLDGAASPLPPGFNPELTPPAFPRVVLPTPAPPPSLRAIIGRLLEKDPAARYQDAYALIDDLCRAARIAPPQESAAIRESFLQAAPFVGRRDELAALNRALAALTPPNGTAASGSAWLVGGESGVGKSRLLDEVRVRAATQGVLVLRGAAMAEGGAPYHAWRDPLRRLVLATQLDDLDAGILKGLIPDIDDLLERPVKAAARLSGPDYQKRLIAAIASLFARQTAPSLLLLEDLQWAGGESLDVLRAVVGVCAGRPLLLIASYRSEESPELPAALPGLTTLKLDRLPADSVAELSASMLGEAGRQAAVIELLQRESGGNAYFMVEIARALAEEVGRLREVGTRELPRTVFVGGIQLAIERRLNRVPENWRPLLRLAAVAGRELDPAVLGLLAAEHAAASAPQPGESALNTFLTLCANCAVLEVADERWRFAHDRLREGALAGQDEAALAALHRRVAEAIERAHPADPQQAGALAAHWRAAGLPERELAAVMLAGNYSLGLATFAEAASYFERALELLPTVYPTTNAAEARRAEADLLTRLGEARYYTGDYIAAATGLRSSLDLYRDLGDSSSSARVLVLLGDVFWRQSAYAEAEAICDEGLALARTVNDGENASRALNRLGMLALEQGDFEVAARHLEASRTTALPLDNPALLVSPTNNLGIVAFYQGDYAVSKARLEETIALCRQVGERGKMAMILTNLGSLAGSQQDMTAAARYFEESLGISRAIGDRHSQILALINLGSLAEGEARYADAEAYLRESLALSAAIGNRKHDASGHVLLGNVKRLSDQPAEAAALYRRALAIALEIDALPVLLDALCGLAQVIDDPCQGLAWLAMIQAHPSTIEGTRRIVAEAQTALATGLSAEQIAECAARGAALDPKIVAGEIIAER